MVGVEVPAMDGRSVLRNRAGDGEHACARDHCIREKARVCGEDAGYFVAGDEGEKIGSGGGHQQMIGKRHIGVALDNHLLRFC